MDSLAASSHSALHTPPFLIYDSSLIMSTPRLFVGAFIAVLCCNCMLMVVCMLTDTPIHTTAVTLCPHETKGRMGPTSGRFPRPHQSTRVLFVQLKTSGKQTENAHAYIRGAVQKTCCRCLWGVGKLSLSPATCCTYLLWRIYNTSSLLGTGRKRTHFLAKRHVLS